MLRPKIVTLLVAAAMILATAGCEDENTRLAEMAEKQLDRQAEQNRQMIELERQVAEGSRHLVEADAQARGTMIDLHHQVQAERAEVDHQRDALEDKRRTLAAQRRTDPILAAAISSVGLVLACLLPLVVCWLLLRKPERPAEDQILAEMLIEDLVADAPFFLPPSPTPARLGSDDKARLQTAMLPADIAEDQSPSTTGT